MDTLLRSRSAIQLAERITARTARIGIVGMGYVGYSLAEATTNVGFATLGFEVSADKVAQINSGTCPGLTATMDKSLLADCDVVILCVQTPVDEHRHPDLRSLEFALSEIATYLRPGQLISIESSIATGTTRRVALRILQEGSKLKGGDDFYLAYSPERVDPGNRQFCLGNIPKVVAGLDEVSRDLAVAFYTSVVRDVVVVSSLEAAELTKLLENTFRLVNISLVNELAEYARCWGIDLYEVVSAAATKPFAFLPHYPGPGAGGHCIPVDPHYLLEDARKKGIHLRLVDSAGQINDQQPARVVEQALRILHGRAQDLGRREQDLSCSRNGNGKVGGAALRDRGGTLKVLLVGVTYKPDVADTRESPALKIWELLEEQGMTVSYHDPYVSQIRGSTSVRLLPEVIEKHDLLVIVTPHSVVNHEELTSHGRPILDTRNALGHLRRPHVYNLSV